MSTTYPRLGPGYTDTESDRNKSLISDASDDCLREWQLQVRQEMQQIKKRFESPFVDRRSWIKKLIEGPIEPPCLADTAAGRVFDGHDNNLFMIREELERRGLVEEQLEERG